MEIAKTIVQQVIALDPWAFGAYGATKLFEIPECSKYAGGLMFTVNGKKHKGNVLIFLKWSDVYKIVFMSEDGSPVKEVDEVYRMSEFILLQKRTGIRLRVIYSENYYGDELDYKIIQVFVILNDGKINNVLELNVENKTITTDKGIINFKSIWKK